MKIFTWSRNKNLRGPPRGRSQRLCDFLESVTAPLRFAKLRRLFWPSPGQNIYVVNKLDPTTMQKTADRKQMHTSSSHAQQNTSPRSVLGHGAALNTTDTTSSFRGAPKKLTDATVHCPMHPRFPTHSPASNPFLPSPLARRAVVSAPPRRPATPPHPASPRSLSLPPARPSPPAAKLPRTDCHACELCDARRPTALQRQLCTSITRYATVMLRITSCEFV